MKLHGTHSSALFLGSILLGSPLAAQTPVNPQPTAPGFGLRPSGLADVGTVRVASGLSRPIFLTHSPGDPKRLFIVEQTSAQINILDTTSGTVNETPFLDLNGVVINSGSERGLLALAFHPNYKTNGLFYVNYSRNGDGDTVIAEYQVTGNPDLADSGSARILLTLNQPQSNHNGGWLGFSPLDDYLYIATGDGGNFCDTGSLHTAGIGNAQDLTSNLLGKMLRIDPLGGSPYGVPNDNPFVGVSGDDETWAYGLRNPWRASFDRLTGDLYIADVGQDLREEVNFQSAASPGGENYGWRCEEGTICSTSSPSSCPGTTGCNCPAGTPGLVTPVHEYGHQSPPAPAGFVCSITGGYVYRGKKLPQLRGHYFFADYCGDAIWSFRVENGVQVDYQDRTSQLTPSIDGFTITDVSSFGEDSRGELYLVDRGGEIFKIVPRP